jgi:hypothetical protein
MAAVGRATPMVILQFRSDHQRLNEEAYDRFQGDQFITYSSEQGDHEVVLLRCK